MESMERSPQKITRIIIFCRHKIPPNRTATIEIEKMTVSSSVVGNENLLFIAMKMA